MVGVLTWGITLSMLFFGGRADSWGVRPALIAAISLMIVGRAVLAAAPALGLPGGAVLNQFLTPSLPLRLALSSWPLARQ